MSCNYPNVRVKTQDGPIFSFYKFDGVIMLHVLDGIHCNTVYVIGDSISDLQYGMLLTFTYQTPLGPESFTSKSPIERIDPM